MAHPGGTISSVVAVNRSLVRVAATALAVLLVLCCACNDPFVGTWHGSDNGVVAADSFAYDITLRLGEDGRWRDTVRIVGYFEGSTERDTALTGTYVVVGHWGHLSNTAIAVLADSMGKSNDPQRVTIRQIGDSRRLVTGFMLEQASGRLLMLGTSGFTQKQEQLEHVARR